MKILESESFKKGKLICGDETYSNDKKAVVISDYGVDDFRIRFYNKIGDTWVNELTDRVSEIGVQPEVKTATLNEKRIRKCIAELENMLEDMSLE